MVTDQAKHWNSYYDKKADFRLITSQSLTQILDKADDSLPKTCLDIGCGTGQLTRELFHRGYTCLGNDLSDSAIKQAKENTAYTDSLQYMQADFETVEDSFFAQKTYSLITCKLVFAFIQDKEAFIQRVGKLLAKNGTFVVITPINAEGESSPIAVDFEETMELLQDTFDRVETFDGKEVTYFICR